MKAEYPVAAESPAIPPRSRLGVKRARTPREVDRCLRLRYEVFATELGAALRSAEDGMDRDRFDRHAVHLMVYDRLSGETVATTRLLTSEGAVRAGSFYSETEFELAPVLARGGRFLEVGRTCIHPEYRSGMALALLWRGIAGELLRHEADYLMGCASIPLSAGGHYVASAMSYLRARHLAPPPLRVRPRVPLACDTVPVPAQPRLPTLLRGYLRQGAMVCGEPYWDAEFGVADLFVLLDRAGLAHRYRRRFVQRRGA